MKNKNIFIILFLLIVAVFVFFFISNNKKETLAVIGAMDVEVQEVLNNLSNISTCQQNDFKIITGNIGKYKIVLSKSGVGKVASAVTTQFIIDKFKPDCIICVGIAGGLSSDLHTGDTVIAEKMIQHDFDVTAFGCSKGYMSNGIEPNKPTVYYSDKNLIKNFVSKYKNLKIGTIVTGDIFVTDLNLKRNLNKEFNADAVDMESAAIAQTAKRNNIPVIVLRTISDEINHNTNEYKQNKQSIAKIPALIVIEMFKSDK